MAVYEVVKVPHEALRARAIHVEKINAGVLRLLDNMRDTLYAYDGIGLAAPQVGVSKRVIVVDPGENLIEIINPQITYQEGEQIGSEGCLSLPGVVGLVKRAQTVEVKGLDRNGQEISLRASDLLARALQHEIDHLDGVLFTDKAMETRREKKS